MDEFTRSPEETCSCSCHRGGVLGEGINIPNADTCMFVEPRNSYRSIIQAIGRILRHHAAKPLGHIILPAVAVLKRGPSDHVPVAPTSAESKQQTKNCTGAIVEPKGTCIALLDRAPRLSTGFRDDSSDANERDRARCRDDGEWPGHGYGTSARTTATSQHQIVSDNGSVSSKQSRTKHKQFTMTAGSRGDASCAISDAAWKAGKLDPFHVQGSFSHFGSPNRFGQARK